MDIDFDTATTGRKKSSGRIDDMMAPGYNVIILLTAIVLPFHYMWLTARGIQFILAIVFTLHSQFASNNLI
jgi:hypothetical protein